MESGSHRYGTTGSGFVFAVKRGQVLPGDNGSVMISYDSQANTLNKVSGLIAAPPSYIEKCHEISKKPPIWMVTAGEVTKIGNIKKFLEGESKKCQFSVKTVAKLMSRKMTQSLGDYLIQALVFGTEWDGETYLGPRLFYVDGSNCEHERKRYSIGTGAFFAEQIIDSHTWELMPRGGAASVASESICQALRDPADNHFTGGCVSVISLGEKGLVSYGKRDIRELLETIYQPVVKVRKQ